MKLKASITKKIAAFRMSLYTPRKSGSQLGIFVLAFALLALPLAGVRIERVPLLTPLVTELTPLGASLQAPPANLFRLSNLVAPAKLVLGLLPSVVCTANAASTGRIQIVSSIDVVDSLTLDSPNGRSPPF